MTDILEFMATERGERLDKLVQQHLPTLTRVQVQALIKEGQVTVDGKAVKAGEKFKGGEQVRVELPVYTSNAPLAEEMSLNILYEDDSLVVLDKPAGLVVHPGAGNTSGTLVNGLLARYPELALMAGEEEDDDERERVGIVHRLDKDTSGLMVVARNAEAHRILSAQFQDRQVDKVYIALLERTPKTDTGIIDAPIGRDPRQRKRMGVQANGRPAKTQYEVTDSDFRNGEALIRATIFTGRTHQIRVHMAFIGCPVVGDQLYGFKKRRHSLNRHFLHATHLAFDHPVTGKRVTFDTPLPGELLGTLATLKK